MTGESDATESSPLRVVLVIARFPPHHVGGYELRCHDVARELVRRGHQVLVVTSRFGARGLDEVSGVTVHRVLSEHFDGVQGRGQVLRFVWQSTRDVARLRSALRRHRADVLCFWHLQGVTAALLGVRRPAGCGVLSDVSSDWLLDIVLNGGNWYRVWERRAASALGRGMKSMLSFCVRLFGRTETRRPRLPVGRAYFTSRDRWKRYLAAGVPVQSAEIITSGIDLRRFRPVEVERDTTDRVVLFLGRVKRRKGLHTAVLALGDLPGDVRLRIVGPVEDRAYLTELGELARAAGSIDRLEIRGPVPHTEVPQLLAQADVLVFPSEEPEAFSRLVLESFAVGTPVVGTTLGGTGEVLEEGRTGFTFQPGNAPALARQLARALTPSDERDAIVQRAQELVRTRYSITYTVDQIEALLREAHAAAG